MSKYSVLNDLFRYFSGAQRVVRSSEVDKVMGRAGRIAADEPSLMRHFTPEALGISLNSGHPLAVINPGDFEGKLARGFEPFETQNPAELSRYIDELANVAVKGGGWSSVPELEMSTGFTPAEKSHMELPALFVEGHEGRHRTRAMERLGNRESLVRLLPSQDAPIPHPTTDRELLQRLQEQSPVYGEEQLSGDHPSWAGGEDFPFLRWYKRGGHVNGRSYG